MNVAISNTSEKPIYQQLFEQISAQIIKGEIEKGYSLPSIRQAATELRVSIITVKKAWEELERCGLIYTVTGKGCFVDLKLVVTEIVMSRINGSSTCKKCPHAVDVRHMVRYNEFININRM